MLLAAWRSLFARKARLLMSVLAIVLGVAFVAGSLIFTQTLDHALSEVESGTVSDVIVRPAGTTMNEGAVPADLIPLVRNVPGVEQVDGQVLNFSTYVLDKAGRPFGVQGAPGLATNYHSGRALGGVPGLQIRSGRAPTAASEIALDPTTAQKGGFQVGDSVVVVTTTDSPAMVVTLVGLIQYAGGVTPGASLVTFDTATAQQLFVPGGHGYQRLWVVAQPGTSAAQLTDRVAARLPAGYEAVTGVQVAQTEGGSIRKAMAFVTVLLLVFAGVALVAGGLLIMNTFSMLVASRTRELALFRAVGASRGQVTRSVLFEALVLGVIGSLAGLVGGIGLAVAVKQGMGLIGFDLSETRLVIPGRSLALAAALGIVVTLAAGYLPARRSASLPPMGALRDDLALPERTIRWRSIAGVVLLVGAGLLVAAPVRSHLPHQSALLAAGLGGVMVAMMLLAPALCRLLIHTMAIVLRPVLGNVGSLAEQNAIRDPRRTAATAGSVVIGLTLVTFMTVLSASAVASVDRAVPTGTGGIFVVSAPYGTPFSASFADQMEQVQGVASVARIRRASVSLATTTSPAQNVNLVGTDARAFTGAVDLQLVAGSLAQWTGNALIVSERAADARGIRAGDEVVMGYAGRQVRQRVAGIFANQPAIAVDYVDTLEGMNALGVGRQDRLLYVTAEPAADVAHVRAELERVVRPAPMVSVQNQAEYAAQQRKPIDQLLRIVYALLGLTLVIAALGILNTLALSVVERTREIGLLRAIGMTRMQVRRMVRVEALMIAVVGSLIGTAVGIGFAIAVQGSLVDRGITVLVIPWARLGLCVFIAAVIGVLAAWWPARRAARAEILAAIATN